LSTMISHRLDLAVLLIDTTTGYHINTSGVKFTFDRPNMPKTVDRGSGTHILLNAGRENMYMTIEVNGYETYVTYVNYEELDERVPMMEVFLIPSEKPSKAGEYISLKGKLPGLSNVSLLMRHDCVAHTDSFDKKKKILTVFEKGNRLNQEGSPYGIINDATKTFVRMDILENVATNQVRVKEDLTDEFSRNAPICRMMFGYVEPDGSYLIRVRDDRSTLKGLIRYSVDGEIRFEEVDFHNLEKDNSKEVDLEL